MTFSTTANTPLPAEILPATLNGRHLVVFDGVCFFCSGFARTITHLDRRDRFRFATAQSPLGEALLRHFDLPVDDYETNLVIIDGVAYQRLDGFIAAMEGLGWPWRAARLLRLLPAGWRDRLYGLIARNRYRVFGKRAQCDIPSKALREKLLG